MISVCIPVYNHDVRELTLALLEQARNLPVEIILIDDASGPGFREINIGLEKQGVRYYELRKNIGRAKIRNRFREYARFPNLLFLDCDSVIIRDNFLQDYMDEVKRSQGSVMVGGRIYPDTPPSSNQKLHWKYGVWRESQPVDIRSKNPARSFMSNNFLVPLKILEEIPFEEKLSKYGHEDTLFGYQVSKKRYSIIHIDNPVLHGVLQSNKDFMNKTKQAVDNLVFAKVLANNDPKFIDSVYLLRTVENLRKMGLLEFIRVISLVTIPFSLACLRLGIKSLKLLDLYKLGVYLRH